MNKIKLLLERYKVYKLYNKYHKYNINSEYDKCKEVSIKILKLEKKILENERHILIKQNCMVYCPKCKQEVNFNPNTKINLINNHEQVICGNCNHVSNWDYPTPVPILLD